MNLADRDQQVIWHPLTQHQITRSLLPIKYGKGAYLYDEKGQRYLDLVSSWWVNLFGHAHPDIANAIHQQALTLEHVIFAGFTHEPAVKLAEELLKILPHDFSKIFYSDNGSTSVEVALKMAFQYWRNAGQPQRKRFIAFENGYHGDTFGAMSVGKKSGYFSHFEDLLFEVKMFPYPETWINDINIQEKETHILNTISDYLEKFSHEVSAMIIEPLIQGASGMRMCRPQFLQQLEKLMRAHDILIIYDEVMTGFGRTGSDFACKKANTTPDIICLAKGLTGGFLPLAVTVCQEKIYESFLGEDFTNALAHGHSFTANPLGCAAGLAALKLLNQTETKHQIALIEKTHRKALSELADVDTVKNPRYCGTVAAFDLAVTTQYGSHFSVNLREKFLHQGLLIRPLGNVIYFLPPYCVTEDELTSAYEIVVQEIQGVIA